MSGSNININPVGGTGNVTISNGYSYVNIYFTNTSASSANFQNTTTPAVGGFVAATGTYGPNLSTNLPSNFTVALGGTIASPTIIITNSVATSAGGIIFYPLLNYVISLSGTSTYPNILYTPASINATKINVSFSTTTPNIVYTIAPSNGIWANTTFVLNTIPTNTTFLAAKIILLFDSSLY